RSDGAYDLCSAHISSLVHDVQWLIRTMVGVVRPSRRLWPSVLARHAAAPVSGSQRDGARCDGDGQLGAALKVGVDGGRGGPPLRDGPDDQRLPAPRVTRDEHTVDRAGE